MRPRGVAFNRNRTVPALRRRFWRFFTVTTDRAPDDLPLAEDAIEVHFVGSRAQEDDTVEPCRYEVGASPKHLAAQAFASVSRWRMADLLGGDDPQTRGTDVPVLRANQEHEMRRAEGPPVTLNTKKFRAFTNAPRGGKRLAGHRSSSLLVDGHRQAMTALAAAVRQDLLPSGGGHAGAKPVGAEAAKVVRLVRAFHVRWLR